MPRYRAGEALAMPLDRVMPDLPATDKLEKTEDPANQKTPD